jgi:hypothetical protein
MKFLRNEDVTMKTKITAILVVLAILLSVPIGAVAGQAMAFTDVKGTDWFKPYIDVMSGKGICVGYGNGQYGPKDNLQVDQLIKFVVIALGYNPQPVTGKDWAAPYISKAKELGLIKDGEFNNYSRKITRGEIARIIARGMKETFPDNLDAYQSLIADYKDVIASSPDREYILKVYCKGIVNGYTDGRFGPKDNATRGEASKMIVCLIDPSKRTSVDVSGSKVVDGYTIQNVHTINVVTSHKIETGVVDLSLIIHFRYPLEDQLSEAEKILKSKLKDDFVKQIMDYAKKKKDIDYELIDKTFRTVDYDVSVKGYGWTIGFIVYRR